MHDVRVRAAYERTPRVPRRFSLPINRMRGLPRKGLISLLSLTILPRFPCPFKPEALVFLLKSRGSILLPRFPRIPRKIRFPRRNSARFFHLAIFKLSSEFIPLNLPFKYSLNSFICFQGGGLQVKPTSIIVCYIKKLFYMLLYIQITCDLQTL